MKVAGAPITWGVCEVPGWGHQMGAERVFREMRELGLEATELGPPGYLPDGAADLRRQLDSSGLSLAGGFLAAVLHEPDSRAAILGLVVKTAAKLAAAGAEVLVLAAALPAAGYETRERLTEDGWAALIETLSAVEEAVAARGLRLAVHPHAGTAIAGAAEVTRLLERTTASLCLDTGHLFLGGVDPAELARAAGARVSHVHLKDVDAGLMAQLAGGRLSYLEAIRAGLYRPLGQGDLDLEAVFGSLQESGYEGWYVLEQDVALAEEPAPGEGPLVAARQSVEFFRALEGLKGRIAK